jgi:hypothetical protein
MTQKKHISSQTKELGLKLVEERVRKNPSNENKRMLSDYKDSLKPERITMSRS